MGILERSILLLLASSVSALGSLAEPPVVTKVEPGQGFTNVATPITVRGAGFEPQAKVALLPGGVTRAGADADIDVHGVAVAGDHAYAVGSSSSYTFRVVDIGDPSAPLIVGGLVTLPGPTAVAVSGTTAFVTGYYWNYPPGSTWEESATWLALVDVSAPAAPFLIESYFLGSWKYPEAIAVSGDTLFVLSLFDGLRIYDLGDPAGPAPVSWLDTGQNARGMSVSGRHLFVAAGEGGLVREPGAVDPRCERSCSPVVARQLRQAQRVPARRGLRRYGLPVQRLGGCRRHRCERPGRPGEDGVLQRPRAQPQDRGRWPVCRHRRLDGGPPGHGGRLRRSQAWGAAGLP